MLDFYESDKMIKISEKMDELRENVKRYKGRERAPSFTLSLKKTLPHISLFPIEIDPPLWGQIAD